MAGSGIASIGSLARHCLAWLLILAIGAILMAAVVVPRLGGATPYVIESGSMSPRMPAGTLVVVRPVDVREIGIGTVITYQVRSGQPEVVTHRVVGQGVDLSGRPRFRTRGDENSAVDDGWVRPAQVKGERWYAVPRLGYVTTLLTGGQRQLILDAVVAVLLGYAIAMFGADLRDRRRTEAVPHG
jgi:signal peptidase